MQRDVSQSRARKKSSITTPGLSQSRRTKQISLQTWQSIRRLPQIDVEELVQTLQMSADYDIWTPALEQYFSITNSCSNLADVSICRRWRTIATFLHEFAVDHGESPENLDSLVESLTKESQKHKKSTLTHFVLERLILPSSLVYFGVLQPTTHKSKPDRFPTGLMTRDDTTKRLESQARLLLPRSRYSFMAFGGQKALKGLVTTHWFTELKMPYSDLESLSHNEPLSGEEITMEETVRDPQTRRQFLRKLSLNPSDLDMKTLIAIPALVTPVVDELRDHEISDLIKIFVFFGLRLHMNTGKIPSKGSWTTLFNELSQRRTESSKRATSSHLTLDPHQEMEVKLKNAIEKATESSTDDVEMPVEVKKEGKAEKKDKAEKQRTAKPERRPSVTRSGNHTPTFNVFIAGRDTDRIFPLGSSVHLVEDRPKRGRKPTQKATTMLILDSHVDPDHVDKGTCMFTYVIDNPHHYTVTKHLAGYIVEYENPQEKDLDHGLAFDFCLGTEYRLRGTDYLDLNCYHELRTIDQTVRTKVSGTYAVRALRTGGQYYFDAKMKASFSGRLGEEIKSFKFFLFYAIETDKNVKLELADSPLGSIASESFTSIICCGIPSANPGVVDSVDLSLARSQNTASKSASPEMCTPMNKPGVKSEGTAGTPSGVFLPQKRGRGRPRKFPRPEDVLAHMLTIHSQPPSSTLSEGHPVPRRESVGARRDSAAARKDSLKIEARKRPTIVLDAKKMANFQFAQRVVNQFRLHHGTVCPLCRVSYSWYDALSSEMGPVETKTASAFSGNMVVGSRTYRKALTLPCRMDFGAPGRMNRLSRPNEPHGRNE